jgi:cytochrome c oxidase subunit 2
LHNFFIPIVLIVEKCRYNSPVYTNPNLLLLTVTLTEGDSVRSVQSTLFTLLVASGAAYADTTLNLTQGVSPISRDVYELHMLVFWICVAIGVVVFGVMAYAMVYHRKSRGAKAAEFHTHPVLEIAWTIVPALILVALAIPSTKVLLNMNNYDKEDLTIKITGYQWKWHYEYLEDGINFFSNLSTPLDQLQNRAPKSVDYLREVDRPLVVPIHKKIRFLITSNDVNHAWWVPDLGVKRDAIGGFINEAWTRIDKPGTYRGQCAELCGINHAFMPIVVVAMSEDGYKDWVAKQKGQVTAGEAETNKNWALKELTDRGQEVYNRICAACHQPTGVGLPPTFPALKGSKIATGPIAAHIDTVFNGRSGTAMQAFKSQLSDVELAAVITYERNAFGNNTGTVVQPIQIKTLRDGKTMEEALATKPTGTAPAAPASAAPAPAAPVATLPAPVVSAPVPTTAPAAPSVDTLQAAMARGEKIYLTSCAVCHQPTGAGMPPTFPALKGSPIVTGPVAGHIDRVMNGKQGTAMVAFKDQLSDQDLADVITYERNAWGNNTGTQVTPEQIKTTRQQSQNK